MHVDIIEKSFWIDPLTSNNAIYSDSLILASVAKYLLMFIWKLVNIWSFYHFPQYFFKCDMLLIRSGCWLGFLGAGKRTLPNWIFWSIFPIEFMLVAKFVLCSCLYQCFSQSQCFFGLLNHVPSSGIFTPFTAFLFFHVIFIYKAVNF